MRSLGLRRRGFRDWRRDLRVRVEIEAELNDTQCSLEDISIGGARIAMQRASAPRLGDPVQLTFTLSERGHSLYGVVIRSGDDGLQSAIGVAFAGGQPEAMDLLAAAIHDLTTTAAAC